MAFQHTKIDWFKTLSYLTLTSVLVFILLTFKNYGISNDEEVQHVYGELLLSFYQSGFKDLAAFQYKNLYLYGGFFDLLAALLEKVLPLWLWDVRHLLSALFGLAGLVAVYKTAQITAGQRAAFLALIVLSLTGAWTGAMFTHTKDISFAACMAWSLYYTVRTVKTLPHIPLSLSLKLGIAVGCALGLRIGAAFAVIFLCLAVLLASLLHSGNAKEKLLFAWQTILGLIPAGLVAFVLMSIFWPWALMGADHIFIAVKSFSHFAFNMNTIADGEVFNIGNVPRTYLFEYLGVRLHELFLLGLVCGLALILLHIKKQSFKLHALKLNALEIKQHTLPIITICIALFVPILFVIFDRPALYNGVRHFTFIIPTLAILSGIGLSSAITYFSPYPKRYIAFIVLCILLGLNTFNTLRNLQPYEYLYYNHFAGKDFKEAVNDWEGDYWSSSLKDAAQVLKRYVNAEASATLQPQAVYLVAACAEAFQMQAYLDKRFKVTSDWVAADFYISSNNMHCDHVLNGQVIGTVKRLGAILATVKDRRKLIGKDRLPHSPT